MAIASKAVFLTFATFSGVLCYDDAEELEFSVEGPIIAAQAVVAAEPLIVSPTVTSSELWSQVLPFDLELHETSSITESTGTRRVTTVQMLDGVKIWNARGNLNIKQDGSIVSSFHRFVSQPRPRPREFTENSVNAALDALQRAVSNPELQDDEAELVYVQDKDGGLHNAWHFYAMEGGPVESPQRRRPRGPPEDRNLTESVIVPEVHDYDHYWDALVDADTLEMIAVSDLVHKLREPFKYNVFAMPVNDPSDGGQTMNDEVFDDSYSPIGWQDLGPLYGGYVAPYTMGNNIFAMTADYTTYAFAANNKFDYKWDAGREPEDQLNLCLSQLFYTNNRIHDILYAHGFDEASGNFQLNNFGRGGAELDPIYTLCHAYGKNNAQMMTLPDGSPGIMSMFIWHFTAPKRDSSLDGAVVTHEYVHGMSQRLTGGPGELCLSSKQSGGMGEGWGDFFGMAFHTKQGQDRNDKVTMASYLVDYERGIRRYPYTSDMDANPTDWSYYVLYKSAKHQIGEIWAIILYECYWNLVEEFGWSPDLVGGDKGNNLMFRAVIGGMKYQPCDPTFLQARDAILAALKDLGDPRGAKAEAAMWRGFAMRGLGANAKEGGVADFSVPSHLASLVPLAPNSKVPSISKNANKSVIDAVLIALGITVVITLLVAMCLVYRNYRLRKTLLDSAEEMPTARTPLRMAMDSPYRAA